MINIAVFTPDGKAAGHVELLRDLVEEESDYRCTPEGILTLEQVKQVSRRLNWPPKARSGAVGEYRWVETFLPLRAQPETPPDAGTLRGYNP